jgi:Tol biopolymer transport system component
MSDRAQVYLMNPDGSQARRITNLFSAKRGAFSRDGRLIAFDGRARASLFDFDIFVANVDGSHRRQVTRGPERDVMASWSPDGKTLAFARYPTENAIPDLWLVGADGVDPRKLVEGADSPRWSPDGQWIAYGGLEVGLVRPDGTERRTLTSGSEPAWSPDGSRIVFTRGGDVWTMKADGTGERRLTRGPAEELTPSVSPDGRWILFTRDRSGLKQVYVMRPDGSGVKNVSRSRSDDWSTDWQALR